MVPIFIPEATEEVKECPLHPKVCLINQGSYFSSLLSKQKENRRRKKKGTSTLLAVQVLFCTLHVRWETERATCKTSCMQINFLVHKGDVTRYDSQPRVLAQHSVAMLEQCCNYSKQHRNNVATLCCANNRCCESSHVLHRTNFRPV